MANPGSKELTIDDIGDIIIQTGVFTLEPIYNTSTTREAISQLLKMETIEEIAPDSYVEKLT